MSAAVSGKCKSHCHSWLEVARCDIQLRYYSQEVMCIIQSPVYNKNRTYQYSSWKSNMRVRPYSRTLAEVRYASRSTVLSNRTKHEPAGGLHVKMSFQFGRGSSASGAPSLSAAWSSLKPRTNSAVISLSSRVASRFPRHVVLPATSMSASLCHRARESAPHIRTCAHPYICVRRLEIQLWAPRVPAPRITVHLRAEVDIAEGIHDERAGRYSLAPKVERS